MAVPSPCGKLQSLRELGAKMPAARRAAALCGARPAATLVIMFAGGAAALAVAAQGSARQPRDLVVSSMLERIGATASGDAEDSVQIATDAAALHADQLIVNVRFTNSSDHVLDSIRITSPIPAD